MKKLILLTLSVLILFNGCVMNSYAPFTSTSKEFKGQYSDFLEAGEIEVNSWYHYVTSTNSEGNYIIRKFFPETKQITSFTTFKSKSNNVRHGLSKQWSDDGTLQSEGNYINGKREGEWSISKGGKNDSCNRGPFKGGQRSGLWKSYDTQNRLMSEINYVDGIKEGPFIEYDSLSTVINEGIYKADTIFQESMIKKSDVIEQMPQFSNCDFLENKKDRKACTDEAMLTYIYKNIKYPVIAREYGVEGTTLLSFVIYKDGSVQEVKVISGLCESMSKEVRRIDEKMPDWYLPGIQDGEKVKVQFNLPIKFKLN